jgi:hypothetical protein
MNQRLNPMTTGILALIILVGCTQLPISYQSQPLIESSETPLAMKSSQTSTPNLLDQTQKSTDTALPDPTATFTLISSVISTQTSTELPTLTYTPLPTSTETMIPSPTDPPTLTPVRMLGEISGRILLNGLPLTQTVSLILEDQRYNVIQELAVSNEYVFDNIPPSTEGYNVLFTMDRNPQYSFDEVASWAWIGPVPVQDGDLIRLADLDIALFGLYQLHPPPDTFLSAGSITPQTPLVFEWSPYPSASHYWLDLRTGQSLQMVWQSASLEANSVTFDGILANGEPIQPGTYWWRVSARIDDISMTISGPLAAFTLNP